MILAVWWCSTSSPSSGESTLSLRWERHNCPTICLSVCLYFSLYMFVCLLRLCQLFFFFSLSVCLSPAYLFSLLSPLLHLSFHLSPLHPSLPPPFPLSRSAGWLPVELVKAVGGVSSQAHEVCAVYRLTVSPTMTSLPTCVYIYGMWEGSVTCMILSVV